ncbi:calcineurin-like phosphoesterase domain-containing protein [Ditylenchus destructor]|nr:calcineurin-like phosphoesterase domain-containing protein [Ditylenchus destructor]
MDTAQQTFLDGIIKTLMELKPQVSSRYLKGSLPIVNRSDILRICKLAVADFAQQSRLLRIESDRLPMTICADLHAHFFYLPLILRECGMPPANSWLFLGDYVDRGAFGVETICLLLALKLRYPQNVFMLRGNHEEFGINVTYGFFEECLERFNDHALNHRMFLAFQNVFNHMPLAALVGKRILGMHGGLSPELRNLSSIDEIPCPTFTPMCGLACDLMWSDPVTAPERPGWTTSRRGVAYEFDDTVVQSFCQRTGVQLIVRGHQEKSRGYEIQAEGKIVTIFSAPDYVGKGGNSAVLNVSAEMVCRFKVFRPIKSRGNRRDFKRSKSV